MMEIKLNFPQTTSNTTLILTNFRMKRNVILTNFQLLIKLPLNFQKPSETMKHFDNE